MQRTLDKFEQIVNDAEYAVSILGNPDTGDFELLAATQLPLPQEKLIAFHLRGLEFLGTIGICAGRVRTAIEYPLVDAPDMCERIARAFTARIEGGFAELERLWRLQDPRNAN